MKRSSLVLTASIVLLLAVIGTQTTDNLVRNPSFEGGTHLGNWFYQTCTDGPWWELHLPIETPVDWEFYFAEDCPCGADPSKTTDRPEAGVITLIPDPLRVRNGLRAFRAFTFWECHSFWLQQTVTLTPTDGAIAYWIDAEAYTHAWFSECSSKPHDPPYHPDCDTRAFWPHDITRLCVAPAGVFDPRDPQAICSEPVEVYGMYDTPVTLSTRVPFTGSLELMVWSESNAPLKHSDWYVDDVSLTVEMVERARIFLPLVGNGR